MNKQTKSLKDLVINSLNVIEKSCKTMAKSFGTDYVPMNMYLTVLVKAKWKVKGNETAQTYAESYNKMLDEIGREASKDLHTSISLVAISLINRKVKESFSKGLKEVS